MMVRLAFPCPAYLSDMNSVNGGLLLAGVRPETVTLGQIRFLQTTVRFHHQRPSLRPLTEL